MVTGKALHIADGKRWPRILKALLKLCLMMLVLATSGQILVAQTRPTQQETSGQRNSPEGQKPTAQQPQAEAPARQPAVDSSTQQPAPQGTPLTLGDALDRANRQNLELATARLRRAVSQAGIRIAGQLPNPSIIFYAASCTTAQRLPFRP